MPEHIEDLGGITVKLVNSVFAFHCPKCGDQETAIPDMQGLVQAVALVRALTPCHISGKELRFMRRALDMTQKEFAEKMELAVETVSRWENDHTGTGGFSEKLVRHNICALLYKEVLGVDYDPKQITEMRIVSATDLPEPITMERVSVRREREPQVKAWGEAMAA